VAQLESQLKLKQAQSDRTKSDLDSLNAKISKMEIEVSQFSNFSSLDFASSFSPLLQLLALLFPVFIFLMTWFSICFFSSVVVAARARCHENQGGYGR
jgi:hypothetical protein